MSEKNNSEIRINSGKSLRIFSYFMILILILLSVYSLISMWGRIEVLLVLPLLIGIKVFHSYLIANLVLTKSYIYLKRSIKNQKISVKNVVAIRMIYMKDSEFTMNHIILEFTMKSGFKYFYPARLGRENTLTATSISKFLGVDVIQSRPVQESIAVKFKYYWWEVWL